MPTLPAMEDRHAVADALREVARLLDATGESPFKVRAWERAAHSLDELDADLGELVEGERLTEIPGVGKGIAPAIEELWRTGTTGTLERLRSQVPAGWSQLVKVPDLGPKRVLQLHRELGVETLDDLSAAAREGRIAALKGFSRRTEERLLAGIEALAGRLDLLLLPEARELAERLAERIESIDGVEAVHIAGPLRRWVEAVDGVDLLVLHRQPAAVLDAVAALPAVAEVVERGSAGGLLRLGDGTRVRIDAARPADLAPALLHATGSEAHLARLRERAAERGLTLRPDGLYRDRKRLKTPTEDALYAALDLPPIPPELREDAGELEAADAGDDFADLVTVEDVRGFVHCHTTWSDGRDSLEEMAKAAEARGAEYLTITDHSGTAAYAGGLTTERLKLQWREIARVQRKVDLRLLRGTESDILADGRLDFPDPVLARLDVVIASIHARHRMDRERMTERIVRAMRHPCFTIWGHALGRLLNRRPPFDADVPAILDAMTESRSAVEINGDPRRIDMASEWVRVARERGLPFVLSVDAHSTSALDNLIYAVQAARRGGVRRSEVLNALPADAFVEAVRPAA